MLGDVAGGSDAGAPAATGRIGVFGRLNAIQWGVLMIARMMRIFPGVVASAMMLAMPAYAERGSDAKHGGAYSHRRIASNARSARLGRYKHSRRTRNSAWAASDDADADVAAANANEDRNANDPSPDEQAVESGVASWYGGWHQGHITSSGRPFDQNELTAAHPWLPLGSHVRVTLIGSDRSVDVTITDRPGNTRRVIDLSRQAARLLGILHRGTARVTLSQF